MIGRNIKPQIHFLFIALNNALDAKKPLSDDINDTIQELQTFCKEANTHKLLSDEWFMHESAELALRIIKVYKSKSDNFDFTDLVAVKVICAKLEKHTDTSVVYNTLSQANIRLTAYNSTELDGLYYIFLNDESFLSLIQYQSKKNLSLSESTTYRLIEALNYYQSAKESIADVASHLPVDEREHFEELALIANDKVKIKNFISFIDTVEPEHFKQHDHILRQIFGLELFSDEVIERCEVSFGDNQTLVYFPGLDLSYAYLTGNGKDESFLEKIENYTTDNLSITDAESYDRPTRARFFSAVRNLPEDVRRKFESDTWLRSINKVTTRLGIFIAELLNKEFPYNTIFKAVQSLTTDENRARFIKQVVDIVGEEKAKELFQNDIGDYDYSIHGKINMFRALALAQMPLPPFDIGMLRDATLPQFREIYKIYGVAIVQGNNALNNFQRCIADAFRLGGHQAAVSFISHLAQLNDPESYFDVCLNSLYRYRLTNADISIYSALTTAIANTAIRCQFDNLTSDNHKAGFLLFRAAYIDAFNNKDHDRLDKTFPARSVAFSESDNQKVGENYYNLVSNFLHNYHKINGTLLDEKKKIFNKKMSLLMSTYKELNNCPANGNSSSDMLDPKFGFGPKLFEEIKEAAKKLILSMANAYLSEGKFDEALALRSSPEAKMMGININEIRVAELEGYNFDFEQTVKSRQTAVNLAVGPSADLDEFYKFFKTLPKGQQLDVVKAIKRVHPAQSTAFFGTRMPIIDAQLPSYLEALQNADIELPTTLAEPKTFATALKHAHIVQHKFLLAFFERQLPTCHSYLDLVALLPSISAIPNSEDTVIAILNHLAKNDKEGISYYPLMECILFNYDRFPTRSIEALQRLRQNQQSAPEKSQPSDILKASLIMDAIEHEIITKKQFTTDVLSKFISGKTYRSDILINYLGTFKISTESNLEVEFTSLLDKFKSALAIWEQLKIGLFYKQDIEHKVAILFGATLRFIDQNVNLSEAIKFYDRFKSEALRAEREILVPPLFGWKFLNPTYTFHSQLDAASCFLQIISQDSFTFEQICKPLFSSSPESRLHLLKEMKRVLGSEACNQFFANAMSAPTAKLPHLLQSLSEAEITLPNYLRDPSALQALLKTIKPSSKSIVTNLYASTLATTWNTPTLIRQAISLMTELYEPLGYEPIIAKIIQADSSNSFFFNIAEEIFHKRCRKFQSYFPLNDALVAGYKKLKADPNSLRPDASGFLSGNHLITDALLYDFDQCGSDRELKSHAMNFSTHSGLHVELIKKYLDSLTINQDEKINLEVAAKLEKAFDCYHAKTMTKTKSTAPMAQAKAILIELRATYKRLLFAHTDALIAAGKHFTAKEILEAAKEKAIIKEHRVEAGLLHPQNYFTNPQALKDIDSAIADINKTLNPSAGFFGFLGRKEKYERIPTDIERMPTTLAVMGSALKPAVATQPAATTQTQASRSIPLPEPTAKPTGLFTLFAKTKQNPIQDTMRAFFNKFSTGSLMTAISHYEKDPDGKINPNSGVISLLLAACAATTFESSDRGLYIDYLHKYHSSDSTENQLALFLLHALCTLKEEFALSNLANEFEDKHPIDLILLAMEIANKEKSLAKTFHPGTDVTFSALLDAVHTGVKAMFIDSGVVDAEAVIKVAELKESAFKDMKARSEEAKSEKPQKSQKRTALGAT